MCASSIGLIFCFVLMENELLPQTQNYLSRYLYDLIVYLTYKENQKTLK